MQKMARRRRCDRVFIDDALNVIFPLGCEGDGPVSVFMAHTDTVFPDTEPFTPRIEDGKMHCPGVGDDTANLATLLLCAKYVIQNGLKPADGGVVFVANAGEEGLGNLKGSRAVMERYGHRVRQFISYDGSYPNICSRAVGSSRYRVEVLTEGGHSFGSFGNRNAIHLLAQMITDFYALKVPVDGDSKTTYNVGGIQAAHRSTPLPSRLPCCLSTVLIRVSALKRWKSSSRASSRTTVQWASLSMSSCWASAPAWVTLTPLPWTL